MYCKMKNKEKNLLNFFSFFKLIMDIDNFNTEKYINRGNLKPLSMTYNYNSTMTGRINNYSTLIKHSFKKFYSYNEFFVNLKKAAYGINFLFEIYALQNLFYVSTLNKIINTVLKKKYLEKNPWNLQEIQIGPFYFILDPKKSKKQELRITNKKKYLKFQKYISKNILI